MAKKVFKKSWDIIDIETARETLNFLITEGHRKNIDATVYIKQLNDKYVSDVSLREWVESVKVIKINNKERIESYLYSCSDINAWDFFRGAHVANISVTKFINKMITEKHDPLMFLHQ